MIWRATTNKKWKGRRRLWVSIRRAVTKASAWKASKTTSKPTANSSPSQKKLRRRIVRKVTLTVQPNRHRSTSTNNTRMAALRNLNKMQISMINWSLIRTARPTSSTTTAREAALRSTWKKSALIRSAELTKTARMRKRMILRSTMSALKSWPPASNSETRSCSRTPRSPRPTTGRTWTTATVLAILVLVSERMARSRSRYSSTTSTTTTTLTRWWASKPRTSPNRSRTASTPNAPSSKIKRAANWLSSIPP